MAADVLPALHAVQSGEVPPGTGKPPSSDLYTI